MFVQRIESNNTPGWEQLKHRGSLFSTCKRWKERKRDDSFRSQRRERDYVSLSLSLYFSLIIACGYGAREAVSFPLSITVFSRGINVCLPHESGQTRFRPAIPGTVTIPSFRGGLLILGYNKLCSHVFYVSRLFRLYKSSTHTRHVPRISSEIKRTIVYNPLQSFRRRSFPSTRGKLRARLSFQFQTNILVVISINQTKTIYKYIKRARSWIDAHRCICHRQHVRVSTVTSSRGISPRPGSSARGSALRARDIAARGSVCSRITSGLERATTTTTTTTTTTFL